MKYVIWLVLNIVIALIFNNVFGQTIGDSTIKNQRIFYTAEVAPSFPGGVKDYYFFLSNNLKVPTKKEQSSIKTPNGSPYGIQWDELTGEEKGAGADLFQRK